MRDQGKQSKFVSKIEVIVEQEVRHHRTQYILQFVMEKFGSVLIFFFFFFACFFFRGDLFMGRGFWGWPLGLVGGRGVRLSIWLAIPLHQSQQIWPLALVPAARAWVAPGFQLQMGSSPGQLSGWLLSVSPDTSFTDKWAAASPSGLLMVQLPQLSSMHGAGGDGCVAGMGPDIGRQQGVCLPGSLGLKYMLTEAE